MIDQQGERISRYLVSELYAFPRRAYKLVLMDFD